MIRYHCRTWAGYGAIVNIFQGGRNLGKTYSFCEWAIKDFLATGRRFVFSRRWKTQLDKVKTTLFDVPLSRFAIKLEVVGDEVYITRAGGTAELAGWLISLDKGDDYKSGSLARVNKWCLDEFIETSSRGYVPGEYGKFLRLYDTIDRLKNQLTVWLFANAELSYNPYFTTYSIDLNAVQPGRVYKRRGGKVIFSQLVTPAENIEEYRQSAIAAIADEEYISMAASNSYADDLTALICKRPKGANPALAVTDGCGGDFTLYWAAELGAFWVAEGLRDGLEVISVNAKKPIAGAPYRSDLLRHLRRLTNRLQVRFATLDLRARWYYIIT